MRHDHEQRSREIVAAAVKVISKEGLEALTIKRLAAEVGVTDAAIYRHFKSKDAILAEVVDKFSSPLRDVRNTIIAANLSSIEKIEMLFNEKCLRLSRHPEQTMVMRAVMEFRGHRRLNKRAVDLLEAYRDDVVGVIREGQERGEIIAHPDPEHLYFMLIGGLHALVQRWEMSRRSFDLRQEGAKLWYSMKMLLGKNVSDIT
ncbi:MAG TPA: TetR family transcriptional regulator [bacterium]|nr:TetR family transcriptional regulator [bacterium]